MGTDDEVGDGEGMPSPPPPVNNGTPPPPPPVDTDMVSPPPPGNGGAPLLPHVGNGEPPPPPPIDSNTVSAPPRVNDDARPPSNGNRALFVQPPFVSASWLQLPLQQITACDLGHRFAHTLDRLCELEYTYDLVNKTRGFSAKGRPAQLDAWIRLGRGSRTKVPQHVVDATKFAKVWWEWWLSLQPEWRGSSRPLSRVYGGSWEPLLMPGANAMLGPVACLYWWGRTAKGFALDSPVVDIGSVEGWEDAVEDVNFVLEGLIKYNTK